MPEFVLNQMDAEIGIYAGLCGKFDGLFQVPTVQPLSNPVSYIGGKNAA